MNMLNQLKSLSDKQKEILEQIRDASYETLRGKDKNGIPFLRHIFELHFAIFGETCSSCPNKIAGYIQKLKKFNTNIKMELIKSEFNLNEGVIIPVSGTSDVYSQHNLTDESAIKLLSENPNRKSLFRTLPDNVDELIENYIKGIIVNQNDDKSSDDTLVSIGESKVSVEEAISLLGIIDIKTKANTVTGIGKKIAELSPELLKELTLIASDFVTTKQLLPQSIPALKLEYEAALLAYQELEATFTEDEKAVAFKTLEEAQVALEEAEGKIN